MGQLVGAKVESSKLSENNRFIYESKEAAKSHEWLYQCTTMEALKSILKSKEIWLSNLKNVNDMEEVKRITVPEFEKAFYVACFTYENNIPQEHWKEYGNEKNGVLFSFKKEWISKKAKFMYGPGDEVQDDNFKIYKNYDEALKATWNAILEEPKRIYNPYFIFDFNFYQIVYDDNLKREMSGECVLKMDDSVLKGGRFITPEAVGIIKNTHGLCKKTNTETYDKDWTSEKEVRLKIGVKSNYDILPRDIVFPKMAVELKDNAFDELQIRFSPTMAEEKKNENIKELKELLPNSTITLLE